MMQPEFLDYGSDIIDTVAAELAERVAAAEKAGVRRWRIVLDPGLGFAKDFGQNVEILRGLGRLRAYPELYGLPWLIGLSRKSFVRRMADEMARESKVDVADLVPFSNAAALMVAMCAGADIIRVHDPVEAKMLARVADSLWRGRDPLALQAIQ
jgi:2-amino-4-hydroxy-6-hydroxymethyldihydropteridine diphosphokinase / dihydropteroate synthase